jgi:hypothetical protein
MSATETSGEETCFVCGKSAAGGPGFSHLYHEGRQFALCCPVCVQMFQRAPDRFARGERPQSVVEELLNEMQWKDPTKW